MRRTSLITVALAAACAALPGCTGTDDGPTGDATTATPAQTTEAPTTAGATDEATGGAEQVRTAGTAITSGDVSARFRVPEGSPEPTAATDEDGAVALTVSTVADGDGLLLATDPDLTAETQSDGSVLLSRDGQPVGALTSTGSGEAAAPYVWLEEDGLLVWQPGEPGSSFTVTLATVAVRSATWAQRDDEGGESLVTVPSTWARAGGVAADELLWAQLVAAAPEADTDVMHNQLTCHQIGAPDKESWNLEPWRPDVGLVETMLARCNPTA